MIQPKIGSLYKCQGLGLVVKIERYYDPNFTNDDGTKDVLGRVMRCDIPAEVGQSYWWRANGLYGGEERVTDYEFHLSREIVP